MTTVMMRESVGLAPVVEAAWDMQASSAGERIRLADGNAKVFQRGPLVFGVAGRLAYLEELKYAEEIPVPSDGNIGRFVTREMLPALRRVSDRLVDAEQAEVGVHEVQVLLGVGGRVFDLSGLDSAMQFEGGVYAIGSGREFAMGAYAAGANMKRAIQIASSFDTGTGPDVRTDFWVQG